MRMITAWVLALGLVSLGLAVLLAPAPAKVEAEVQVEDWEAYIASAPTLAEKVKRAKERVAAESR